MTKTAPAWRRYFTLYLPLAVLIVGVTAEILSAALSDRTRLRHPGEYLLADLRVNRYEATLVLMGDSVTKNVADAYALAPPGTVANLTDNKSMGMVGAYFVLQRYLTENPAPRAILVAGTPEYLSYTPTGFSGDFYITSTFRRQEERDWLSRQAPGLAPATFRPAVFEIESDILAPLAALPKPANRTSTLGERPVLRTGSDLLATASDEPPTGGAPLTARAGSDLTLDPVSERAWSSLCELARRHGIALAVAVAPAPASAVRAWQDTGRLEGLLASISGAGGGACAAVRYHDFNSPTRYPDALFKDDEHLRLPDATAYYAAELSAFMAELRSD